MEEAVIVPVKLPEKWPWPLTVIVAVVAIVAVASLVVSNRYAFKAQWKGGGFEVAPAQLPPAAMPPH